VHAGVRPGEEPITQEFFEARGEVVLDAAVGRRAGAYLARYSRSHGVEIADALVASAAATAGLHLWTLNRKHYPMPDVRFYEPRSRRTSKSPGSHRSVRAAQRLVQLFGGNTSYRRRVATALHG
jgi:hypothetical protein